MFYLWDWNDASNVANRFDVRKPVFDEFDVRLTRFLPNRLLKTLDAIKKLFRKIPESTTPLNREFLGTRQYKISVKLSKHFRCISVVVSLGFVRVVQRF